MIFTYFKFVINYIQSRRVYYLNGIRSYTHEIILQDKSAFVDGEAYRLVEDFIYKLEKTQENLKDGFYGGPPISDYDILDDILKVNGCYRKDGDNSCDNIEYDDSFGYTKEIATLPVDDMIREYVYHVRRFLNDYDDGKYIQLDFNSTENIRKLFTVILTDPFFKLQTNLVKDMTGSIEKIDEVLLAYIDKKISTCRSTLYYMLGIGVALFLLIDLFILNKDYYKKVKEMTTLVSIVFLVPSNIANENENFKRFIQTTQVDDN